MSAVRIVAQVSPFGAGLLTWLVNEKGTRARLNRDQAVYLARFVPEGRGRTFMRDSLEKLILECPNRLTSKAADMLRKAVVQ